MDFAKQGDLKSTLTELKAINSELQKNKTLQKEFGNGFANATKSVSTNLDEIAAKTKKAHDALKVTSDAKEIAQLTKEISTLRNEYERLSKTTADMSVKNQKLLQEEAKTRQQNTKAQQQEIKLREQNRKIQEREAKEKAKLNSLYAQESARLNDLRKKYKDMALAEGTASKEARILLKDITHLDNKLKKVDASVGQFQRNVGNYGGALRNAGSSLLSIAGIGGFATIVTGAIRVNAEFEQSMADLKAITGATDEQLKFFKTTALDQATSLEGSTASATEYTEALKLIASAKPELLENQEALVKITNEALLLADASGLTLPEASTKLTDAMNQFGAGADQAHKFVDVLAASAKYGSAEVPQLTDALLEFGSVAKSSNVTIQESAAAIEALAERGIKGTEAGTKLRNILISMSAAKGLPKEAQESFKRVGIDVEILSDNSLTLNERLNELKKAQGDEVAMLKIFGKENIAAAKTVLDQTDRIAELTDLVDENGVAQTQAAERTGTLSAEWKKLGNAWQASMIKMGKGGGNLAKWVKFLRQNLETIITVAMKLIRAFIVYKSVMMATTVATNAYNGAMMLFTKSTIDADKSMKGLNATMKANIMAIVAVAVIELADALGIFQSQADELAESLNINRALLDATLQANDKLLDEQVNEIKNRHQRELDLAQEHEKELIKINQRGELRTVYQKKYNDITADIVEAQAKIRQREEENNTLAASQIVMRDNMDKLVAQNQIDRNKMLNDATKSHIAELFARRKSYNDELVNLNHDQKVDDKETQDEIKESSTSTTDHQIAEANRRADEIKRIELELRRWLQDLRVENIRDEKQKEIAQEDLAYRRELEKLEEQLTKLNKTNAEADAIREELLIKHKKKIQDINNKYDKIDVDKSIEQIEFEYKLLEDSLLKQEITEEEFNKRKLQLDIDKAKREIETLEKVGTSEKILINKRIELDRLLRQQVEQNADARAKAEEDAQEAIAKASQKAAEKAEENAKKQKEAIEDIIEETKKLTELSLREIEKKVEGNIKGIEDEISAQEDNIERQRELAEQGLENTLAFEKQVQAEKQARLLEEQKRLEKIKKVETYYNLLASYAESDPNTAPVKALAQMAIAEAIAARFEHGGVVSDEVAKQNGGILQGASHKRGGILIEAEGSEGIFSKKEMKHLGKDNFYALKNALNKPVEPNFMKSQSENMITMLPQAQMKIDMSKMERKLDNVISAIENKPVPMFTLDRSGNLITHSETKKLIHKTIQKRKRI